MPNLLLLIPQVLVVLVTARVVGRLFRLIRQPQVMGEMVAGILLGPSFLGWVAPGLSAALFPRESLGFLNALSQVGLLVFMFLVGLELNPRLLRSRSHAAVVTSHASIVAPFLLGAVLSLFLYPRLSDRSVAFTGFALFLGVAMSITAFPVLARILEERGLSRTGLGATAIACAAVDDVTAWCLLALVVTIVQADALSGALVTLLLSAAYVALVLVVVKPRAARLVPAELGNEARARAVLAGAMSFLLLSALATEVIGIHALFGAFLAGVAMPRHPSVAAYLKKRLEGFGSVFLLPLFFAFTGLRTEIGLLADARGWLLCAGIIAVAVAGKLGGSMLAARVTGMPWTDSFALGALMNTRGLIELVVLNLGYDLGILSPRIFVMLVLMALVTTFMTGPLLHLYEALKRRQSVEPDQAATAA